jgi:phosphatidylglycerophosphatase A
VNNPVSVFRSALSSPAIAIATMLGAGFIPIWPGTIGSALALPLVYVLRPLDPGLRAAVYAAMFLIGVYAAHYAGRQLGDPDHQAIVCDETWSMAVVWELTPTGYRWMLASFIAFRLFDAVKPWPISAIDRHMKNGLGVMLDDAAAALLVVLMIIAVRMATAGMA